MPPPFRPPQKGGRGGKPARSSQGGKAPTEKTLDLKKNVAVFDLESMKDFTFGFQKRKHQRRLASKQAEDLAEKQQKAAARDEWKRTARAKYNESCSVPVSEDFTFKLPSAPSTAIAGIGGRKTTSANLDFGEVQISVGQLGGDEPSGITARRVLGVGLNAPDVASDASSEAGSEAEEGPAANGAPKEGMDAWVEKALKEVDRDKQIALGAGMRFAKRRTGQEELTRKQLDARKMQKAFEQSQRRAARTRRGASGGGSYAVKQKKKGGVGGHKMKKGKGKGKGKR